MREGGQGRNAEGCEAKGGCHDKPRGVRPRGGEANVLEDEVRESKGLEAEAAGTENPDDKGLRDQKAGGQEVEG